jgi:hypothetical protein
MILMLGLILTGKYLIDSLALYVYITYPLLTIKHPLYFSIPGSVDYVTLVGFPSHYHFCNYSVDRESIEP